MTNQATVKTLTESMVQERCDEWVKEATRGGRRLGYESGKAQKKGEDDIAGTSQETWWQDMGSIQQLPCP